MLFVFLSDHQQIVSERRVAEMRYEIQNVVVSVVYDTELDLERLADFLGETRYDPNIFSGVQGCPFSR
ncbi:hypothetical protein AKJ61_02400 [candidate division MSBL1 archaeon SCGC-AAA259B11]|uniref:Uncharacterized protein n=1 Tax=candidate division MSBL1 archaeon SCGC-AAA259B11 TaxID=1698260 RepID=A0A133U642_9EURY|nr:hypothetical protein AKJ61_02400 [candidate division MSBL1 archaeon SCGC-AAA259B11]